MKFEFNFKIIKNIVNIYIISCLFNFCLLKEFYYLFNLFLFFIFFFFMKNFLKSKKKIKMENFFIFKIIKNIFNIFFFLLIIILFFLILDFYDFYNSLSYNNNKEYIFHNLDLNLNLNKNSNSIYFYSSSSIEKTNIKDIIHKYRNERFLNTTNTYARSIINKRVSKIIPNPKYNPATFKCLPSKNTTILEKIKNFVFNSFFSCKNLFSNFNLKLKHDLHNFNKTNNKIIKLQNEFNLLLVETPNIKKQSFVVNKIINNILDLYKNKILDENILNIYNQKLVEHTNQIQTRKNFFNDKNQIYISNKYIHNNNNLNIINLTKDEIIDKLITHELYLKGQILIKEIQLDFYKKEYNIKKNNRVLKPLTNEYLKSKEQNLEMLKEHTEKISKLIDNALKKN